MESVKGMLGSLKGKVWIALSAFAMLNCAVGLLAYLAASYVTSSTFFLVLIPFLLTSTAQVFFGKWLSAEIIRPIDKVNLIARSIERTAPGSLPRTTGAVETDDLLETINRNMLQVHNIVGMMDSVVAGNTSAALAPIENPDRISTSFQKLVAKIKDSVDAQTELEKLRATMSEMTSAVSQVRNGNGDGSKTFPADFNSVIRDVNGLVERVSLNATRAKNASDKVRHSIVAVIEQELAKANDLNRTAFDFGKSANSLQKLIQDLAGVITSTRGLVEKSWQNPQSSEKNTAIVAALRKHVKSAQSRLQAINETSNGIAAISESAEDLARRINLISLNVSLQGKEPTASKRNSSLITAEVEHIAERSASVNKEIAAVNEAIVADIKEIEKAFQATLAEIADLSALMIESENAIGKFGGHFDQMLDIQKKLVETSVQNSADTDGSFRELTFAIAQSEQAASQLKDTEASLDEFVGLINDLNSAVGRFSDSDVKNLKSEESVKAVAVPAPLPEVKPLPKIERHVEPILPKLDYIPPVEAIGANELLEI